MQTHGTNITNSTAATLSPEWSNKRLMEEEDDIFSEAVYDRSAHVTDEIEGILEFNENRPPWELAAQCATCQKWRLIPSLEEYEKLRENAYVEPFICETARKWRAEVSCNDASDISPDCESIWAVDKPGIPRPPPGWRRVFDFRGQGGTHFADVYYYSPSSKRLRSWPDVKKYLKKHPEYITPEVIKKNFSFTAPKHYRRSPSATPVHSTARKPEDQTNGHEQMIHMMLNYHDEMTNRHKAEKQIP